MESNFADNKNQSSKDKFLQFVKDENLSWQKLADMSGKKYRGTYRNDFIRALNRMDSLLNKIGVEIIFKKK